jgi:hypothetical protein
LGICGVIFFVSATLGGLLLFALASALRLLLRVRFGLLVFALASAFCLWCACVAPVRGGTYFSLPPQRKVGKRKRLTPLIPVFA